MYPLGVKPFNYSRTKDDEDTQLLALEKIIAEQDKSEGDKEATGAERSSDDHNANLDHLEDWGLGFTRGTTSPLSLLGANDSDSMDMDLVDYSSEEKETEAVKTSGDKGELEFTEDNILDGEQGDKNEASHEIINAIKALGDKSEKGFAENNCSDGEQGDKNEASHEIINEAKKPVLTQQGIMDLIEHQASSKRTASSAGWERKKEEYSQMLDGYESPTSRTVQVDVSLATLIIISAVAENTNRINLIAQHEQREAMVKQAELHREALEKEFTNGLERIRAEHEKAFS